LKDVEDVLLHLGDKTIYVSSIPIQNWGRVIGDEFTDGTANGGLYFLKKVFGGLLALRSQQALIVMAYQLPVDVITKESIQYVSQIRGTQRIIQGIFYLLVSLGSVKQFDKGIIHGLSGITFIKQASIFA